MDDFKLLVGIAIAFFKCIDLEDGIKISLCLCVFVFHCFYRKNKHKDTKAQRGIFLRAFGAAEA
jgi:hypothetical protein